MTINTQKLREAAVNAKSLTAEDLIGFRLTATAHITGLARAIESCCDHIDAQAAEIARLKAVQAWQPIETAPKTPRDGEYSPPRILLLRSSGRVGIGQWDAGRYAKREPSPFWTDEGIGRVLWA